MIGITNLLLKNSADVTGQLGGASKKVKPMPLCVLFLLIAVAYIMKTYIVYVSYNTVAPKFSKDKYEPITFGESFMLILLVIGLLF